MNCGTDFASKEGLTHAATRRIDGCIMDVDRTTSAWKTRRSRSDSGGQPFVRQRHLLVAKTAAPWRDLPERFGNWNSIFRRFSRWSANGVWSTTCGGRKRGQLNQALGRSRGGFTTKIHAAVNGMGRAIRLRLSGGQRHDMTEAEHLIHGLHSQHFIADKAYDGDPLREQIRDLGAKPAIPSRSGHRRRRCPKERYKRRNVIERFINRIKHVRRVATRYDKKIQRTMAGSALRLSS
jgi:transposase